MGKGMAMAVALTTSGGSSSASLNNVFVYGTLMADEVVHVLLNRVPTSSPAILSGHQRFSIKGRVYPAISPAESMKVTGKVLRGITDFELDVLDAFEDVEYERNTVEVSLTDKSEKLLAYTYVWENEDDPNLYGDWDFEKWSQAHKDDYLKMTKCFTEELEQPESKTSEATYESHLQEEVENGEKFTE